MNVKGIASFMLELAKDENVPSIYRTKAIKLLVNFREKDLIKIRENILDTLYEIMKSPTDPNVRIAAISNFTLMFKPDENDEKIVRNVRLMEKLIFKENSPDVYIEIINSLGKFKSLISIENTDSIVKLFLSNCSPENNSTKMRIASIKGLSQFSSLVSKPTREKIAETLLYLLETEKQTEITDAIVLAFGEIQKYVDISLRLDIINKLFEILQKGELKQVARDVSLVIRQTWSFLDGSQRALFWQKILELINKFKDTRIKANLIGLFEVEIESLTDEAILAILYSLNEIMLNEKEDIKIRIKASSAIKQLISNVSLELIDNVIEDIKSFILRIDNNYIRQNMLETLRKIGIIYPEEKGQKIIHEMISICNSNKEIDHNLLRIVIIAISEIQYKYEGVIDNVILSFVKEVYDKIEDEWIKTISGTILLKSNNLSSKEDRNTILESLIMFLSSDENVINRATAAKLIGMLIPYWSDEEREFLKANLSLRLSIEDSDIVKDELLNTIHLFGV